MKKFAYIILMLTLFVLVGCEPPQEQTKNEVLYDYFLDTKAAYIASKSGNISVTITEGGSTLSLEYQYNLNDTTVESMKLVLTEGQSITEAYVKDGNAYVNVNGEKTYSPLEEEGMELISGYWFEDLTDSVFKALNKSIFYAMVVDTDSNGIAELSWDKEKFTFISEDFTDEEFLAANTRFNYVKENMKEIELTVSYENQLVTAVESTWTKLNDEVSIINIEFHGTAAQSITYPSDLNSYIER